ncbi:apolipoprotein N-acyltransferase [Asticcacaulis sp. AC402]|uniref:apolipoprotein N-acyltransferase n=1 Tax=Asticcacaulis sp. AC402 TaxID=1282361 RepID=UPI001F223CF0|nr:apolipoprotein N-acyltransferase [Asticcacaulis sp. AC402]
MLAIAQPPFGILPGLLGYALLLWALERDLGTKNPNRTAFFMGWLAGFAYFFVGCFWVAEAFLVDAETYGWMAIPAAALLPAGMALFWGLFAVVYRRFAPKGQIRFLWFAALFSLLEMVRGMIFTGFPWNPSGATWRAGSAMSQIAAYVGVYGLGFFTVLIFASVGVIRRYRAEEGRGLQGYTAVLAMVLTLCGLFAVGQYRLNTTTITYSDYVVRVVQPNVGQAAKWSRNGFKAIFNDYVAMSRQAPAPGKPWPDLIIWPEGALPVSSDDLFADDSWTAPVMVNLLRDKQALIFGAYRSDYDPKLGNIWRNSLIAVQQHEKVFEIQGYYNKYKLVPFGEFLPFEDALESIGLTELVHIGDGFTPGKRTHPVTYGSIPRFLPLICFEGIFPSLDMSAYTSADVRLRPKWIVNISNDAWFGPTTGPQQHMNLASFRSIEEGLPMVRSTPTGVSGLIDPLGRMMPQTRLGSQDRGIRDIVVPNPLPATPYSASRFWIPSLVACIFLFFVTVGLLSRVVLRTPDNLR